MSLRRRGKNGSGLHNTAAAPPVLEMRKRQFEASLSVLTARATNPKSTPVLSPEGTVRAGRSDGASAYIPIASGPPTNTVHKFSDDPSLSWLMPFSRSATAPDTFPVRAQIIGDAVPMCADKLALMSDTALFASGTIPPDSFYDIKNAAPHQWLETDDDIVMVAPAVTADGALVSLVVEDMHCTFYVQSVEDDLTEAMLKELLKTKGGVEPISIKTVFKDQLCGATFQPTKYFEVVVNSIVSMRQAQRKMQYVDTVHVWHADRVMWSDALTFTRETGITPQSWVTVTNGVIRGGVHAHTGAHADIVFTMETCNVEFADPSPETIVPTSPTVLLCEDNENYCKKSGSMVNTKQWENQLFQVSQVVYGIDFPEESGMNGVMAEFLISMVHTDPSEDYTLITVRDIVELAQCKRRLMRRMVPTHRGGHNMVGFDDMDLHNQLVLSNPVQRTVWFHFDPHCGGPEDMKLRGTLAAQGVYNDVEKPDIPPHMRDDKGEPTDEGERWQRDEMAKPAIREGITEGQRVGIYKLNMQVIVQRFIFLVAQNRRPWIHAEPTPSEMSVLKDIAEKAPVKLNSLPFLAIALTSPSAATSRSAIQAIRKDMVALVAEGFVFPEWWEDQYMHVAEQAVGLKPWSLADAEWLDYIPGATYYKKPTVLHSKNTGDSVQGYYKSSMIQLFDTMLHATSIWPGEPRGLDAVATKLKIKGKAEMGYGTLFRMYRDWQKAVAASGGTPPHMTGIAWKTMRDASLRMRLIGEYCVHDSRLVGIIYDRAQLASDVAAKSNVSSVSETDVCLRGSSAKGYIATVVQAVAMDIVVNTGDVDYAPRDPYGDRPVQGAHVFPAMRGLHHTYWGFTLDFNSLYPAIAQQENYGTGSLVISAEQRHLMEADGIRITHTRLEGVDLYVRQYDKDNPRMPQGVLPALWRKLIGARNAVKALMKKEKDPSVKRLLNARQQALKILANSLYGCFGFAQFTIKHFRSVAALITSGGRNSILAVQRASLEDFPDERLLSMRDELCVTAGVSTDVWDAHFERNTPMIFRSGDTDSGFVRAPFKTEKVEGITDLDVRKLVIVYAKWMAADITDRHFNKFIHQVGYKAMNLAFEYIIKDLIVFMQKNYFGTVWEFAEQEPQKLKKGLMTKDDLPEILKDCMAAVAEALQDIDTDAAATLVRNTYNTIIASRLTPHLFVKRIKIKDPSQLKNTNVPHAHQYYHIMERVQKGCWSFEIPEFGNKMPTVKRQPTKGALDADASAKWWEHPDWMQQEAIPVDVVYYMEQLLSKVAFMTDDIVEFQSVYDLTAHLVHEAQSKYGKGVDVDGTTKMNGKSAVVSRVVKKNIKDRRRAATKNSTNGGKKRPPPTKGTVADRIAQRKVAAKRLKK